MPRGISQQDVFDAADALLERGERPTIERVRREIGRGSPNTVNPLLDAWWQSLSERLKGEGEQEGQLPRPLLASIQELYEKLQRSAIEDANEVLAERLLRVEERETDLARQAAELEAKGLALNAPLETLKDQLSAQTQASQAQIAAERDLRKALAEAQADARRLATLLAKSERERENLREKHAKDLDRLHDRFDGQERHWLTEIDQLRQELREQRSTATKAEKTAQHRIERLEKQLLESRGAEREALKELRALRKELEQTRRVRPRREANVGKKRTAKRSQKKTGSGVKNTATGTRKRPSKS